MKECCAELVSIVLPTYNHSRFLVRAINSVITQSYRNWELIIVDNFSTDNTSDVVSLFNDSRIKYCKFSNHGIIAASRNFGISVARGTWIAFLDSDDWWTEDKLIYCMRRVDSQVDFIFHDLKLVNESKYFTLRLFKLNRVLNKPIINSLLINGNPISTSSVIVRTSIITKANCMSEKPDLVCAEDYHTWLRISELTDNFLYLPQVLGYYFFHPDNNSKRDMSIATGIAVSSFLHHLKDRDLKVVNSNLHYMSGRFHYLVGNFKIAKQELFMALDSSSGFQIIKILYMIFVIFAIKSKS